jgi:glyoxylase-like metal-dependent hydrolase (beta-lactamase superfamily II)
MITVIDLNFLGVEKAIASFLVKTSEGPILIETGPHSVLPQLEKVIQKEGFELKDIKKVFLTHIHLDHAGAAWYFADLGAEIYLHPFGVKHMNAPAKLMESARRIYKEDMDRLWGEMKEIPMAKLQATEHEAEIQSGDTTIKALHTPGHAVHHIAWQIGDVLFTGDVAGVRINHQMPVPPCPPPDINIEDWKNSIRLIRNLDVKKLYLTHFGLVEDIESHLNQLEVYLDDWANWMKPRFENGEDPKEITPIFQEYVKNQLLDNGVNPADLDKYEAANPTWMSVAGLMRYWKKKTKEF